MATMATEPTAIEPAAITKPDTDVLPNANLNASLDSLTPASAEPEPQNELTKKFTEAEREGVKELRSMLPDIFLEAFPDKKDAKNAPLKLWGVEIDPTAPSDPRISVVLVKFLRARDLDVAKARAMLASTLKWRDEFKVDEIVNEEFPEAFGPVGKVFGTDKEHRPITYNLYGANKDLDAVFGDVAKFMRWRVGLMERGVLGMDFQSVDTMLQIHDYDGVGLSSQNANSKAAASQASKIFQDYYPELLYKKFFINTPSYMNWMFWLFKPLLPAKTMAKMTMMGRDLPAIKATLSELIDVSELPKRYGGEAEAF